MRIFGCPFCVVLPVPLKVVALLCNEIGEDPKLSGLPQHFVSLPSECMNRTRIDTSSVIDSTARLVQPREKFLMKAKLVPTTFSSLNQVVASLRGPRSLRRSLMALNVLPCEHRRPHAEQNQCRFRGRHKKIPFVCRLLFLGYPCVLLDLALNPVVMCEAFFPNGPTNPARCLDEMFIRTLAR